MSWYYKRVYIKKVKYLWGVLTFGTGGVYICRKKMKYIPIIICIMFLMLSCGNKNKAQNDGLDWECLDSIHKVQEKEYEAKEVDKSQYPGKHSPVISSSSGGYSSNDDEEKEYDNMRGFDPASEDDMEDNGMSRYMENNDEEGWD